MDLLEPAVSQEITAVWFLCQTRKLRLKLSASGGVPRIDLGSASGFLRVTGGCLESTLGPSPRFKDYQRLRVWRGTANSCGLHGFGAGIRYTWRVRRNKIVSAVVGSSEGLWLQQKVTMVTMMPKPNRMATLAILRASSARLNEDQVSLSAFVFVDRSIARRARTNWPAGLAVTDNAPVVVADGRSQLHSNWAGNPPYQLP